jgi:hypothetical protein
MFAARVFTFTAFLGMSLSGLVLALPLAPSALQARATNNAHFVVYQDLNAPGPTGPPDPSQIAGFNVLYVLLFVTQNNGN